jgi:hypothetical protein
MNGVVAVECRICPNGPKKFAGITQLIEHQHHIHPNRNLHDIYMREAGTHEEMESFYRNGGRETVGLRRRLVERLLKYCERNFLQGKKKTERR